MELLTESYILRLAKEVLDIFSYTVKVFVDIFEMHNFFKISIRLELDLRYHSKCPRAKICLTKIDLFTKQFVRCLQMSLFFNLYKKNSWFHLQWCFCFDFSSKNLRLAENSRWIERNVREKTVWSGMYERLTKAETTCRKSVSPLITSTNSGKFLLVSFVFPWNCLRFLTVHINTIRIRALPRSGSNYPSVLCCLSQNSYSHY